MTRSGWLAVALAGGALFGVPAYAADEAPRVCAEAIAQHGGDDLEALAAAEQAQWRVARGAEREVRKLARGTIGMGESQRSVAAAARIDQLRQELARATRTARILCQGREQRGDPHRQDCETLYQRRLPPRAR